MTRRPAPLRAIQAFLQYEASGGILLLCAALLALVVSNSALGQLYDHAMHLPVVLGIGDARLELSLQHFINDALMAIFFLLVGTEIKREIAEGELSQPSQILLPAGAAIGGMLFPAMIYVWINGGDPVTLRGWAIPAATDIAFSLAILNLLGSRVPLGVRVFLTTLAILDDLGAILIIALFYSSKMAVVWLGGAAVCVAILLFMNRQGMRTLWPYILVGLVLWFLVLRSGVHATIAGVVLAFCIPIKARSGAAENERSHMPGRRLEHMLNPWVAYAILPIFAFANAGVSFAGLGPEILLAPITLGIALGLFVGKQIGIFTFSYAIIKLGWARMPTGANWGMIYGASICAGIGFTMSLFIGALAFTDPVYAAEVRLGVLVGSFASAILGYLVLRVSGSRAVLKEVKAL